MQVETQQKRARVQHTGRGEIEREKVSSGKTSTGLFPSGVMAARRSATVQPYGGLNGGERDEKKIPARPIFGPCDVKLESPRHLAGVKGYTELPILNIFVSSFGAFAKVAHGLKAQCSANESKQLQSKEPMVRIPSRNLICVPSS